MSGVANSLFEPVQFDYFLLFSLLTIFTIIFLPQCITSIFTIEEKTRKVKSVRRIHPVRASRQ